MIRGLAQQCFDEDGEKIRGLTYENGDFGFMVSKVCTGRRFVVTKTGYVGMVPKEAEKGDVIALLGGAQTPFVIRRLMTMETCEKGIGTSS
jgi:hypothetical protein